MSETAVEPEAQEFEREVTSDEPVEEVLRQRRPHSDLVDAAKDAYDTITDAGEVELPPGVESTPPPNQDPVTAVNRQAALAAAREAGEPAPAEDEPVEEPAAEIELPPPAPVDWLGEEPDFEAEARAEVDDEPEEPEAENEFDFEDDPRLREERIKRIAAEKRAEHFEAQRLKDARKGWVDEALEHAPLAAHLLGERLEKNDAKSKRAFMRAAGEAHNQMRAALEATLGPATEIVAQEAAQARAEAKADAAAAFGEPTAGPGAAPAKAAEIQAKVAEAQATKGLKGAIRAMLDGGVVNP